MKNILIVWDGNYPWDIRVEKECDSLLDADYSVHIVARNTKQQVRYESFKGVTIHRLPRFPTFFPPANKIFSFPFFFNPVWLWNIYKIAKKHQCSAIIVRDLPLAIAGIAVSKLLRLPILLDMAECYPELLRASNESSGFRFVNLVVRNPRLAEYVEIYSTRRVDLIYVMADEARLYLANKGINASKTVIVSNTPVLEKFNSLAFIHEESNEIKIIYVGLVSKFRGLHNVITAMGKLIPEHPNLHFKIVGSGSYLTELKQLVSVMNLDPYIEFTGWVDNSIVPQHISECDIGIVPHKKCAHSDTTIPNKLFDYMAIGKPVIVSNARPMERIVTTENCGVVYNDDDIDSLSECIKALMDKKTRITLGQNGLNAVKNKYNWGVDQGRFIAAINNIILSR